MTTTGLILAAALTGALATLAAVWWRSSSDDPPGLDEPTDPRPPPAIERPEPRDYLEELTDGPTPTLDDDPADPRARDRARRRRRAVLDAERRYQRERDD